MAEPTAEQEMMNRINSLNSKVNSLQSDVRLSSLRDEVEDMDTRVNSMRSCIEELRAQGYVFGKGLEAKADSYVSQWKTLRPGVMREITGQAPALEQQLSPLESQFTQIRSRSGTPGIQSSVDRLESQLETLESRVSAVKNSIKGMYDNLEGQVNTLKSNVDQISEMLQQFASATFRLLPTEGAVMAVKATYSRDEKMDKDDPQGYLFLTDQRLLFEQNQEIATKKVLFITTETKKVQKLMLEVALALVGDVKPSKKGLFGNEDHLAFTFQSGAPIQQGWFHLNGQDCNEWQALIGKSRSGGLKDERAVAIDTAAEQKAQAAPSQCPNCGAPITQVVLRGMDSIHCEYCHFVIRL